MLSEGKVKVLSESTVRIAELECKDKMARDAVRNHKRDLFSKDVQASSFKLQVGELEKESGKSDQR